MSVLLVAMNEYCTMEVNDTNTYFLLAFLTPCYSFYLHVALYHHLLILPQYSIQLSRGSLRTTTNMFNLSISTSRSGNPSRYLASMCQNRYKLANTCMLDNQWLCMVRNYV
jgi:hypothetical protein